MNNEFNKILLLFIICFTVTSCSNKGWTSNDYEDRWIKVVDGDFDGYSGFKKIEMEREIVPTLNDFITDRGLPDYIYTADLWQIKLVYLRDKALYVWNTHRGTKGGMEKKVALLEVATDYRMPVDLSTAIKRLKRYAGTKYNKPDGVVVSQSETIVDPIYGTFESVYDDKTQRGTVTIVGGLNLRTNAIETIGDICNTKNVSLSSRPSPIDSDARFLTLSESLVNDRLSMTFECLY